MINSIYLNYNHFFTITPFYNINKINLNKKSLMNRLDKDKYPLNYFTENKNVKNYSTPASVV